MREFWHKKKAPKTDLPDLKEKFEQIAEYLKINNIECKIANADTFNPHFGLTDRYVMTDYLGPRSSYVKLLLKEYLKTLFEDIKAFISSDISYEKIKNGLLNLKSRCEELISIYNPENELNYKGDFRLYIRYKKRIQPIPSYHLEPSPNFLEELRKHLVMRVNFYEQILQKLNSELALHVAVQVPKSTGYKWNSKNAELEVSELLYVLYYRMKRIQCDEDAGGTFPKLRKIFFGLFGLSDEDFSNKINQIQTRKINKHFVTEMATHFEEHHAKLHKLKK